MKHTNHRKVQQSSEHLIRFQMLTELKETNYYELNYPEVYNALSID